MRRLIIIAVEEGEPIDIDYDGDFDLTEIRMVLREALEEVSEQMEEES